MKTWWLETAWPWLHANSLALVGAWWIDLGEHPGLHFLSMLFGAAVLVAMALAW